MEPMVIEVCGVPDDVPHGRMVDQLKIHFLKRRNSGDDVLTVIYPTATPHQAYVVFESNDVPGVLEVTHILEVENRFYPLHVQRACFSEVDMSVETTLDLRLFTRPEDVRNLVNHYKFSIKELRPGFLKLSGSFLKLKLLRSHLMQLTYSSSTSGPNNGCFLTSQCEMSKFASKSSSNYSYEKGFDKDHSVPSLYSDGACGGSRIRHNSRPSSARRSPPEYSIVEHTQSLQMSSSASSSGSSLQNQMGNYSLDPTIAYKSTSHRVDTIGSEEASSYGGPTGSGSPRNLHSHSTRNSPVGEQASSLALPSRSSLVSQRDLDRLDQRIASTPVHSYSRVTEAAYNQSLLDAGVLTSSRLDGDTLGSHSSYGERKASPPEYNIVKHTQSLQISSSASSSGSSLQNQIGNYSLDPTIAYKSTSRRVDTIGSEEASSYGGSTGSGSPRNLHIYSTRSSPVGEQASSLALPSHSSLVSQQDPRRLNLRTASTPVHSYSRGSTEAAYSQSLLDAGVLTSSRLDGDILGSRSSYGERKASVTVDTDTIHFIQTKRRDIKFIEVTLNTAMKIKSDAELTVVTFSGHNAEKAKDCLLAIMNDIGPKLRTQEINLNEYPEAHQQQICAKIRHYENSNVLIKLNNGVVKLVGSSIESFEIKQKLLELDSKPRGGGGLERSSSLPRQNMMPDQRRSPDPMHLSAATKQYHASKYEGEAGTAPQVDRGRQRDRHTNFNQKRTQSESRKKAVATTEQWEGRNADLPPLCREKISIKQQLGTNDYTGQSTSKLKRKLQQNNPHNTSNRQNTSQRMFM